MQKYIYQAKNQQGVLVKAQIEATTVTDAVKLLREQQLFPLSVEPLTFNPLAGNYEQLAEHLHRVSAKDRLLFTRQLATLVKAGLPLARALRVLEGQIQNPKLLKLLQDITTNVEGGRTLAESLAVYPEVFNQIYIQMVAAGELSGNLDETLLQLAAQEEKNQAINSKIRSALMYPIIVFFVIVAVTVLMLVVVLPKVGAIYLELNQPLPFYTRALLALSAAFVKYWYGFIIAFIGAGIGLRVFSKTPRGRSIIDTVKLRVPMFSLLIRKVYMARFSRTLSSLVSSGVPVLQALETVAKAISNVHLEHALIKVTARVKAGEPLSKPILENPVFLSLVGQMLKVGEQTGSVGESLNKVANYYEDEVDEGIRTIQTLIEPATMIILGGLVFFLIAAVLFPIYSLVSNIR